MSDRTAAYNCLAFVVLDTERWWDPGQEPAGQSALYWPSGVPRDGSPGSWVSALKGAGFSTCPDGLLEPDHLKVAVYALGGRATHAARQLRDGWWVSKLGGLEDIEHRTPTDLEGGAYGAVVWWMRRPRSPQDP